MMDGSPHTLESERTTMTLVANARYAEERGTGGQCLRVCVCVFVCLLKHTQAECE